MERQKTNTDVSGHAGQAFNIEQQSCSFKAPSSCSSRWGNNHFLHVVTCWQITLFKPLATIMFTSKSFHSFGHLYPRSQKLQTQNCSTTELNIKQRFNSNHLMWDITIIRQSSTEAITMKWEARPFFLASQLISSIKTEGKLIPLSAWWLSIDSSADPAETIKSWINCSEEAKPS